MAAAAADRHWGSLWRVMLRRRRRRESGCYANEGVELDCDKREQEEGDETQEEEKVKGELSEDECQEDTIKVYGGQTYVAKIFQALENFRDSSLLTDLTLTTEDGYSFDIHSPVLAAVSTLIHYKLQVSNKTSRMEGMNSNMSVVLGPEVDHVGLQGVVEFAYTGAVASLNRTILVQIQSAAQTLGVPRVLDLCTEEEERMKRKGDGKKESKVSAAEQMRISLQSIREEWEERLGCDVILEVEGTSFDVHRVILAASSDYFRGMFTSGMRESQQSCVTLPFLVASELETLMGCAYSGTLPLSWGCVFEITCTALRLQFQHATSMCLNFLSQEMDTYSCLDVASFAQAYGMAALLEGANDFVTRHFENVAGTCKFKELPARQLCQYLKSNSLCVSSELTIYKAVVAWIEGDRVARIPFAKELMGLIQFSLMTFKDFNEVQVIKTWAESECVSLYRSILEDFCSNCQAPRNEFREYFPKASLVLVGGDQILNDMSRRLPSRELWFANSIRNHVGRQKECEWRRLGEMPDPSRFSHEVVALDGHLYVVGGQKYYGVNDKLNSAYRYDPVQNSWQRLSDMHEKRSYFAMVVLDGGLYAIGGDSDSDTSLERVEHYSPKTNTWQNVHPLDQALSGHAATVLDGALFISGGLNCGKQCLVSLFLYHPDRGTTYLAEMAKPRVHHRMEAMGGHLFVAGGVTANTNMVITDQLACEVYDPVTDSWSSFAPLPIPHVGAASVVLEGKFYVLGGYGRGCEETRKVHRYDASSQRWEHMGKMPDGLNNDVRACLIQLPQHLRQ